MLDPNVTFALLVVLALAIGVPVVMLILHALLGRARVRTEAKGSTYEAGIKPAATVGSARERFSVKFYLIAILFIIFDVEAVFLYPWAVNFQKLGLYGFVEMLIFLAVLFAGFIYILRRGALKWE
ncbi:MAG: NADH-quinone oxidoreductase subunit A [bacterium]|nr:NADH-quinone oxidoreductase subunit A [bacterium]